MPKKSTILVKSEGLAKSQESPTIFCSLNHVRKIPSKPDAKGGEMGKNGVHFGVYQQIANRLESCARLGPPWPTCAGARGSESAKLPRTHIISGDAASLRFQLSFAEVSRRVKEMAEAQQSP